LSPTFASAASSRELLACHVVTTTALSGAAIVGIGRTAYVRRSGRTTLAMAAEAARAAIADAGLAPADVDGFTCYSTGDSAGPMSVAYAIGIDDLGWSSAVFGGGNAVASVVAGAAAAIVTNQADVVVVYRVLGSATRYGRAASGLQVAGEGQFSAPHGYLVPPQWFAMWCRRHQAVHGSTSEDLGAIAVQGRLHASRNRHAIAQEPITIDDYLAGRWVNEPFRVFDCCYEVDGAVALVLTSAERAADLRCAPIYPLAVADSNGGGGSIDQWDDLTTMYSRHAGPRLWNKTGLRPADMDLALMYDCYTYTVMATFEDFGFCGKGEVGDYFREGRATYGGDVVVNPHGGLLSEGYIHGLNHHYEAVLQLRGDAGERQVTDAETALVTAGAGPFGGALVYATEPA
jgi:acetyl-CoA acetyltransferase